MGAFEMSIELLKEASSLAKKVPYLGVIADVLLQIIKIKGVRFLLFCHILSRTESCPAVLF